MIKLKFSFCSNPCPQDAVYIELAGSHTLKEAGTAPDELLALMGARHTIDKKMQQAEVTIFKVSSNKTPPPS